MLQQYGIAPTPITAAFMSSVLAPFSGNNNSNAMYSSEPELSQYMEGSGFSASIAAIEQWLVLARARMSAMAGTTPAYTPQPSTPKQQTVPSQQQTSSFDAQSTNTSSNPIPHDVRYRQQIYAAACQHHLNPLLLAAVAAQETGGPGCNSGSNVVGADGTGHGVFQIDSGTWSQWLNTHDNGMNVVENADKAATILSDNLRETHGNMSEALHLYNAGSLACPSTHTEWASGQSLSYEDSVLRHFQELSNTPN